VTILSKKRLSADGLNDPTRPEKNNKTTDYPSKLVYEQRTSFECRIINMCFRSTSSSSSSSSPSSIHTPPPQGVTRILIYPLVPSSTLGVRTFVYCMYIMYTYIVHTYIIARKKVIFLPSHPPSVIFRELVRWFHGVPIMNMLDDYIHVDNGYCVVLCYMGIRTCCVRRLYNNDYANRHPDNNNALNYWPLDINHAAILWIYDIKTY
jgi:hypothetical protein